MSQPDPRLITDSRDLAVRAAPPRALPGMRRHFSSVHLNRPLAEVFEFFAEPRNLEALTPPELEFRIVSPEGLTMGDGTLIDYTLKLHGIPFRWRSRITRWDPPAGFVDEQVAGPYSVWHHTHGFTDEGDRVRMDDEVRYRLPCWPLGELAAPWVRREIEAIFAYRRARVLEIFG